MAIFTCCGWEEFPITIRCIRQTKIIDHFISISLDVICYIFYTLCKKIYEGETEKRLADRFRAHLRDVEKKNASKPVARHFNHPYHSHHNMTICGLSLLFGNTDSSKKSRRNIHISARYSLSTRNQLPSLISIVLFKFMSPYFQQWQSSSTSAQKPVTTYNSSIRYDDVRTLETRASFPNLSRW